jgi:hypothetical protein
MACGELHDRGNLASTIRTGGRTCASRCLRDLLGTAIFESKPSHGTSRTGLLRGYATVVFVLRADAEGETTDDAKTAFRTPAWVRASSRGGA